jgi:hypothetical protein
MPAKAVFENAMLLLKANASDFSDRSIGDLCTQHRNPGNPNVRADTEPSHLANLESVKESAEFPEDQDDNNDGSNFDSDSESSDSDDSYDYDGSGSEHGKDSNLHPVRRFMRHRSIGTEPSQRLYLDEEDVVSNFCEAAENPTSDDTEQGARFIAIADIRSNVGVSSDGRGVGVAKTQPGVRTAIQLGEDLRFVVSKAPPESCRPTNTEN